MIKRIAASLSFRAKANRKRIKRKFWALKDSFQPQGNSKYHRFVQELESCAGSLKGKRLLEIGSDSAGELLRECMSTAGVASAVGVNPAGPRLDTGRIRILDIDGRSLPFPDDSFDVIASLSVFEHVFALQEVLDECHRVLMPGGVLLAEFGPIWSSCWGHHLWFYYGGEIVDWRNHPLPPYAHLLMERAELESWCNSAWRDGELSRQIAEFVFDSPEQNRLFFSDYEDIARASQFDVVFICGVPDVPHPAGTPNSDYARTFGQLQDRFPSKSGFGYHVAKMMLAKRHD